MLVHVFQVISRGQACSSSYGIAEPGNKLRLGYICNKCNIVKFVVLKKCERAKAGKDKNSKVQQILILTMNCQLCLPCNFRFHKKRGPKASSLKVD